MKFFQLINCIFGKKLSKMKIFIIIFISGFTVFSQHANYNSQKNWSLNKTEILCTFGATQFNGDLGGGFGDGKDYSMKDINWLSTGYQLGIGFRKRFHPLFATTSSVKGFTLKGNDALSNNLIRNARNLNFRSFNIQIEQKIEFIVAAKEKFSPSNLLLGTYPSPNRSQQLYVFSGLGLMYFSNQGYYNKLGENARWVNLRNLQTEGINYSPITLTIPIGVGFRIGINRTWRLGIELSYNKTFSDYIDDVSTVYKNPSSFSDPVAAYLSNPSDLTVTQGNGFNWFGEGYQRGDSKQKDAYYHANFVLSKNITYKDYGLRRKKLLRN